MIELIAAAASGHMDAHGSSTKRGAALRVGIGGEVVLVRVDLYMTRGPPSLPSVFVSNFENKHGVVAAIIFISFKPNFRLGGQ